MTKITFVWYSDPGHAWLEVPRSWLDVLGVAGDISKYSYIDGDAAYLEEDCDAATFLNAFRGSVFDADYEFIHRENGEWIRNLNRFI